MACEKCSIYNGDSTTHYSVFRSVFTVTKNCGASMVEGGEAFCKYCSQSVTYDYDETLIPKLRIEFLATIPDNSD